MCALNVFHDSSLAAGSKLILQLFLVLLGAAGGVCLLLCCCYNGSSAVAIKDVFVVEKSSKHVSS